MPERFVAFCAMVATVDAFKCQSLIAASLLPIHVSGDLTEAFPHDAPLDDVADGVMAIQTESAVVADVDKGSNLLLFKTDIGRAKPSTYDLAENPFTYGRANVVDFEGAREVTRSWGDHIHEPKRNEKKLAGRDFRALNKKAYMDIDVDKYKAAFRKKVHAVENVNKRNLKGNKMPSAIDPSFQYGRKNRPEDEAGPCPEGLKRRWSGGECEGPKCYHGEVCDQRNSVQPDCSGGAVCDQRNSKNPKCWGGALCDQRGATGDNIFCQTGSWDQKCDYDANTMYKADNSKKRQPTEVCAPTYCR